MIYFDHNASTPVDERVLDAMLPYLKNIYGNPSSLYRLSRIARSAINTAREQIAALIEAQPEEIIFTSGGTEANSLAFANSGSGRIFISSIEHPSVVENAKLQSTPVYTLETDPNGQILATVFAKNPLAPKDFVSIMLANNETGAIQNIIEFAEITAKAGAIFHTDAIQALGKIPVSFKKLCVQLMSLSSHKIYGPKGCGALIFSKDFSLKPLLLGGDQEFGLRAGTENVAAIVGFGKAAELAKNELNQRTAKSLALKTRLELKLQKIPNLVIFAQNSPRLANTVQFGINGISGEMLLMQLDRHDIAVSSGSACNAATNVISPVLNAMSINPNIAKSAIRISLGKDNNEQEIDNFVNVLNTLISQEANYL